MVSGIIRHAMQSGDKAQRLIRAQARYAEALNQLSAGEEIDIASLCDAHGGLADELASIHGDWLRVRGVHDVLSNTRPLGERLRKHYGEHFDPAISLQPEPNAGPDTLARAVIERLGQNAPRQSRYKVVEEVARGGMGAILKVWDPDLRRSLAMKVALTPEQSKPSTDSNAELPLARFLEEAQVTGQLDHPGIVPVHELGLDEEGRMFFTMRLVRGENLERIFDRVHGEDQDWSLARAVRLLLKICETMAYAHDKGVIHRDLKPANIMVGRFGEVYVMDWGLARVMGREDKKDLRPRKREASSRSIVRTDRGDVRDTGGTSPLETMDGDVLGTPAYMSPQQALGELESLDQRTDVYALGAMLYHLLTGHMPYVLPGKPMNPYAVWGRLMEDAPHPLEERAPDAPPELVAICQKAMERSRKERYQSVQELGHDLASFLDNHVVRAYERGAVAELRKWVKRNRGTAIASAAAIAVALGGLGGISWVQARSNTELSESNAALADANAAERAAREEAQANEIQALREKERADQSSEQAHTAQLLAEQRAEEVLRERDSADRVIEFLVGLFESPDPARTRGALVTAKDLLDRGARGIATDLEQDPLVRARLMATMGLAYHELGLFDDAELLLLESLGDREARLGAEHPDTLDARGDVALLLRSQGLYAESEALYEETLAIERKLWGDTHPKTLKTQNELARVYRLQGRYSDSRTEHETVLGQRRQWLGAEHPETLQTYVDLARVYRDQDELTEARELLSTALAGYRSTLGDDHPKTLRTQNELGSIEQRAGRFDVAEEHFRNSYEGRRRVLGEDHPQTLWSLADLAFLNLRQSRFDEAEELYLDALQRHRRVMGPDHSDTLAMLAGLGGLYQLQNRLDEAEPLLREAAERALTSLGSDHARTLGCQVGLAAVFFKQGRLDEAEPMYRGALSGYQEIFGPDHHQTLVIQNDLVELLIQQERFEDAAPLAIELVERTAADNPYAGRRAELLSAVEAGLSQGG